MDPSRVQSGFTGGGTQFFPGLAHSITVRTTNENSRTYYTEISLYPTKSTRPTYLHMQQS